MSEKVYCIDCKWSKLVVCRHTCSNRKFKKTEIWEDYYSKAEVDKTPHPSELNRKNNCKGFEPK